MHSTQKRFFTALAPMRDITNQEFCELFIGCGEPDLYISEFLRVHPTSGVDKNIEDLLSKRTSNNPLFIQLLGHDPQSFVRIANSAIIRSNS